MTRLIEPVVDVGALASRAAALCGHFHKGGLGSRRSFQGHREGPAQDRDLIFISRLEFGSELAVHHDEKLSRREMWITEIGQPCLGCNEERPAHPAIGMHLLES